MLTTQQLETVSGCGSLAAVLRVGSLTAVAHDGGRAALMPMTVRLATALREHRHLRSARVLCRDGAPLSADVVKHYVERPARRARLSEN